MILSTLQNWGKKGKQFFKKKNLQQHHWGQFEVALEHFCDLPIFLVVKSIYPPMYIKLCHWVEAIP